jgi:hypothetical protein
MWRLADNVPLHIPKYALDQCKVSFARIMHEEAYMLHSVRQVRASERQVLKGAGETLVRGAVSDGSALCGRELGMRVDRHRC